MAWGEHSYDAVYDRSSLVEFDYGEAKISYEDQAKTFEGKRTLVVIVPGIFGEFIEIRAFESLYRRNDSQFSAHFKQRLSMAGSDIKQDLQFKLKNISSGNRSGFEPVNLDQLFHFGKTDIDGHEVPVVLFRTDSMTLETLGSTKSRATIFNRRLTKLFQVTGEIPDSIMFIGYSLGTPFALEMLNQGNSRNLPWIQSVKGMVSLGGVVHGSILADDAFFNGKSKNYKMLQAFEKLAEGLQDPIYPIDGMRDTAQNLRILLHNSKEIAFFVDRMWRLLRGFLKDAEISPQKFLDKTWIEESVKELSSDVITLDVRYTLNLAIKQMEEYGLFEGNFTEQYVFGIKRLRVFLQETVIAVRELSTHERTAWWKNAELPQHIQYASIAGVMSDARAKGMQTKLAYNVGSPDFKFLTKTYQNFLDINFMNPTFKGIEMNDSQVDIASAQFNMAEITRLNPNNGGLHTVHLGTVNSHHWGLALPVVNKIAGAEISSLSPEAINPFPREALLRALALRLL